MSYHKSKMCAAAVTALLLVLLCGALTACGKKPTFVDPPSDVDDDKFPMVYPDPATDPKP